VGKASLDYMNAKKKDFTPREPEKKLSAQERLALRKLRREAKAAGATLESNGEGGLAPSLVLGVMRRDRFRCTNEHCPDPKKALTVDHISGHPKEIAASGEARRRKDLKRGVALGHINTPAAIHTLCAHCHDEVHTREREIDSGKKPEPMPGEKGGSKKLCGTSTP
jgi:hypothetical protein